MAAAAAGSCDVAPATEEFPYIVETRKDPYGHVTSTLFTYSEPAEHEPQKQGNGSAASGKGKGKGKGPGGPPPPKGGGKGPAHSPPKDLKGHWYMLEGNFKIDSADSALRYYEGEVNGELVAKDGASNVWNVALSGPQLEESSRSIELKLTKDTGGVPILICVSTRNGSNGPQTEARKTGNVFISEVLGNSVLVRNHGMATGAEAEYSMAGQTSPFHSLDLGSCDSSTVYVRSLPGIPGGRLELYDTETNASAERKKLDAPYLKLSEPDITGLQRVTVLCACHGYKNGDRVVIMGVLDKSKMDSKPWDELNEEFLVSDSSSDTFQLKAFATRDYFDGSKCIGKSFDGVSAKVCALDGRLELNQTFGPGEYGKLIAKQRKFGGACGMSQLLCSVESILEAKDNLETVNQDDVDMSVDESAACEKRQCPRCQLFFRVDMFDSHWEAHSSEIMYNLFLGGNRNAWNDIELKQRTGITHILNVASAECASDELLRYFCREKNLTFKAYKAMPLKDSVEFDILGQLEEAVQFIENSLGEDKDNHILVHCAQGISRSASAVIAYLMGPKHRMSLRSAYELTKKGRTVARPNPAFIEQLGKHEMALNPDLQEPTLKTEDVWPPGENYINLDKMDQSNIQSG